LSQPTIRSLGEAIMGAIKTTLSANKVRNENAMIGEYSKLLNEPIFCENAVKNKNTKKLVYSLEVMKNIIDYLYKNVYPLTQMDDSGFDVLGRFYTEFIRYAGSEQKQGLVLTPSHVTDLFCDLVDLNLNDVAYDPCCGTAGFLIAGMKRLFKLAGNDKRKHLKIRSSQLVGVELRPQMYTYACSNMMLRGDGRSNIYCGDCFQTKGAIETHKPTVAFLNPPYDVGAAQQMEFIEHAIDVVKPQQGRVAAIVQMSCGIKDEKNLIEVKRRILEKAHLKAVLSMPDDLFYPVGVVTCVMVFDTSKENAGLESWFGYFKDDGFEKRKNQGRIDARGKFAAIKDKWLAAYKNLKEVPGLSVRHEVQAEDEWCAEAYMETDYSTLCDNDFIRKLRDYAAYRVCLSNPYEHFIFSNKPLLTKRLELNCVDWKWFKVEEWFDKPYKATAYNAQDLTICERNDSSIAYITRTDKNNGCKDFVVNENFDSVEEKNAITIGDTTATIFYQENEFICGDHMVVLRSKSLNKFLGLFMTTLLDKERFRYNYGRAFNKGIIANTDIKLPVRKIAPNKYEPDWQFMEDYIKSLPYSSCL
jgi:type I restriction-modification system DNA methylase subunit